jgi:poly(3-hydroxyoctanoate) depolymerase
MCSVHRAHETLVSEGGSATVRRVKATSAAAVDAPDMLDSADRFVSAAGLEIRVSVQGAGPPLLMVSGLGANIELWEPLTPLLASRQLIRFDPPGSGLSTVPHRPYRMGYLAAVVAAMLDCLDLPAVDVLGYSLGGALAQELAHRHPARLRKLILAATIPGVGAVQNPRTVIEFFDPRLAVAGSERRMRRLARLAGGRAAADPAILAAYEDRRSRHPPSVKGYRFQLRAILGWSSVTWLHTLTAPTLVLAGGRDPIVPLVNSRIFTRLIPDCRRCVVADGGHLFMVDQPEDVAPVIEAFLSEAEHRRSPPRTRVTRS